MLYLHIDIIRTLTKHSLTLVGSIVKVKLVRDLMVVVIT